MRLDHLLSKEHSPGEGRVGSLPPPSVGWGCSIGGDTGEFVSATADAAGTALPCGLGVESGVGAAGVNGEHPVGS